MSLGKEELYNFEEWCVQTYKEGKLRSPIHLSGSIDGIIEDFLIDIFKNIKKTDWVFTTYRSHYHALLKGIPEEWVKNWILDNKSIHVMNSEHRFVTSAIVAGMLPIALGVAASIKRQGEKLIADVKAMKPPEGFVQGKVELTNQSHVYVFIGDMTATLGVFKDCFTYAVNHDLPIRFIIEDNGLSTDTKTSEVWNSDTSNGIEQLSAQHPDYLSYIQYKRKYPHYGCGVFVDFTDEQLKQDGTNF